MIEVEYQAIVTIIFIVLGLIALCAYLVGKLSDVERRVARLEWILRDAAQEHKNAGK